jgi:hypothetical protein
MYFFLSISLLVLASPRKKTAAKRSCFEKLTALRSPT